MDFFVIVIDPDGFEHRVCYDGDHLSGYENLPKQWPVMCRAIGWTGSALGCSWKPEQPLESAHEKVQG